MSFTVIVTPNAKVDIKEAAQWYEAQNQGLGIRFIESANKLFLAISENPLIYPITNRQVRRAVIQKFPYIIFYIVDGYTISVIACFHGKRHPKILKGRI